MPSLFQSHGEQGHHVSNFVKNELAPELLECYNQLQVQPDSGATEAIVQGAFDKVRMRLQKVSLCQSPTTLSVSVSQYSLQEERGC